MKYIFSLIAISMFTTGCSYTLSVEMDEEGHQKIIGGLILPAQDPSYRK